MTYYVFARDFGSPLMHPAAYVLGENHPKLEKILGRLHASFMEFRNREGRFVLDDKEFLAEEKTLMSLLENKNNFKNYVQESLKTIKFVQSIALSLNNLNFKELPDKKLIEILFHLFFHWNEMNAWGHLINMADFEFNLLSNRILAFLEEKKQASFPAFSVGEYFARMIVSKQVSLIQQQDIDLFNLLGLIQENKKALKLFEEKSIEKILTELNEFPEIKKALQEHTRKYDWLQFHYDTGKILKEDHFIELLKSSIKEKVDGKRKAQKLIKEHQQALKEQERLLKKINFTEEQRYWVNVASEFLHLKAFRKEVVFQASRLSHPLIVEIARRLGLSHVQARHLTPEEIAQALKKGKVNVNEVNARIKHCIIHSQQGKVFIVSGEKAKEFSQKIKEKKIKERKEFRGKTAYPGVVQGLVKIINSVNDLKKMQAGDILVSDATNPNLMPAIRLAAAIVTDEGGITCHAAIVSRELKKPCVIGTKIATKALKDGCLVRVDATHGVINILRKSDSH